MGIYLSGRWLIAYVAEVTEDECIAIDGKTLRCSHNKKSGQKGLLS